jgi:hypothetical protein
MPLAQCRFAGDHGGLGAVACAKLAADQLDVKLDGRLAQIAIAGDFLLGLVCAQPGENRHVPVALRPTASIEVQVLLVAGDQRTPRSGVVVALRDAAGAEATRAPADFDGYVLFECLPFGTFSAEAAGRTGAVLTVAREAPNGQGKMLIPAANGA